MSHILHRRLTALQSGHLPPLIRAHIERDLAGASADEINRRVTPDYIIAATRQAITAQRQAKAKGGV